MRGRPRVCQQDAQRAAEPEDEEAILTFGMVRVLCNERVLVIEHPLRFLERDAMLGGIGRRLAVVPGEPELGHSYSVTTSSLQLKCVEHLDQLRGPRSVVQCADLVSCIHLFCVTLLPSEPRPLPDTPRDCSREPVPQLPCHHDQLSPMMSLVRGKVA